MSFYGLSLSTCLVASSTILSSVLPHCSGTANNTTGSSSAKSMAPPPPQSASQERSSPSRQFKAASQAIESINRLFVETQADMKSDGELISSIASAKAFILKGNAMILEGRICQGSMMKEGLAKVQHLEAAGARFFAYFSGSASQRRELASKHIWPAIWDWYCKTMQDHWAKSDKATDCA